MQSAYRGAVHGAELGACSRCGPESTPVAVAQLEAAIADGLDVRGLMYWTLVDNFEWAFGYRAKFGLFEWNPSMGRDERRERPSGKLIRRLFKVSFCVMHGPSHACWLWDCSISAAVALLRGIIFDGSVST